MPFAIQMLVRVDMVGDYYQKGVFLSWVKCSAFNNWVKFNINNKLRLNCYSLLSLPSIVGYNVSNTTATLSTLRGVAQPWRFFCARQKHSGVVNA